MCLSFVYLLFFNFILFLNFTILYWFCQISKWIRHRYTCVPHPEPSSLLPPHTNPLGHPSAPAPSIQYHAANLDWLLVPYMILYVFQCHSPNSSHPLPLPQSPKDCSIKRHWYIILYFNFLFWASHTKCNLSETLCSQGTSLWLYCKQCVRWCMKSHVLFESTDQIAC